MIRCYLAFGYVCSHPCPWSSTHTRAAWISAIDFFTFLLDDHLMLTDPQGSNWVPELSCPTPRTPLALPSFTIPLSQGAVPSVHRSLVLPHFLVALTAAGRAHRAQRWAARLVAVPPCWCDGTPATRPNVMQRHHPGWVESAWPRHLGNGTGTYKGSR